MRRPVFYALRDNDVVKASILADHGLDTTLKNAMKQTPLSFVCEEPKVKDDTELLQIIIKAGVEFTLEPPTLVKSALINQKY